jgi:DNA topoisomerase-3
VPVDLKSAELTAKWEQQLTQISKGAARSEYFITEMKKYSASLVSMVAGSSAKYVHDNMTRQKCPECGKFLLEVNSKRGGKMYVCSQRECGYRKKPAVVGNKPFERRREDDGSASKAEVQKYLEKQENQERQEKAASGNTALAEKLAKWKEKHGWNE